MFMGAGTAICRAVCNDTEWYTRRNRAAKAGTPLKGCSPRLLVLLPADGIPQRGGPPGAAGAAGVGAALRQPRPQQRHHPAPVRIKLPGAQLQGRGIWGQGLRRVDTQRQGDGHGVGTHTHTRSTAAGTAAAAPAWGPPRICCQA